MKITLRVIAGPHEGRQFEFDQHDNFIVGRSGKAGFRLPKNDPYFSRTHFLVEVNPPLCRLMDLNSRNGTFVNHQQVEVAELNDGDLIQGGETTLQVRLEADPHTGMVAYPNQSALTDTSPRSAQDATPPQAGIHFSSPGTASETPEVSDADRRQDAAHVPSVRKPEAVTPAFTDANAVDPCPGSSEATIDVTRLESHHAVASSLLPTNYSELIQNRRQPFTGYQLVDELGRGGMGVVYRAVHEVSGKIVALKTIQPAVRGNATEYARFLREAEILRQLRDPHIVGFHDVGESQGLVYFAMDYIPGTDAGRLVKERAKPLPVSHAVRIVCQLLNALQAAHDQGFVHRDIKPSNILLKKEQGRTLALLTDFGLARTYQASKLSGLTMTGAVGGTIPFMPPEQITAFRDARPAVDQYASAATLYYLLSKHFVHDFPKEVAGQILRILQNDPVPIERRRAALPHGLSSVIARALAREPADRFPNVRMFQQALQPFIR